MHLILHVTYLVMEMGETNTKRVRVSDEVHKAIAIARIEGEYDTMNDVLADVMDIDQ